MVYIDGIGAFPKTSRIECEPSGLCLGYIDGVNAVLGILEEVSKNQSYPESVRGFALYVSITGKRNIENMCSAYLCSLSELDEEDARKAMRHGRSF